MDVFGKNTCKVCKQPISIMIFKGSGLCSDNCRKRAEKEK